VAWGCHLGTDPDAGLLASKEKGWAVSESGRAVQKLMPSFMPAPRTLEDTGLSFFFVVELVAKILFRSGQLKLAELASRIHLPISVLEPILAFMRNERLCEISHRSDSEASIIYNLTDLGRLRANDYMARCQYAGAAPVPLPAYITQIKAQSLAGAPITRAMIEQAFEGIVIKQGILDTFGAAINSGRAVFVYGPAGSGKTFVAEHLAHALAGDIFIPHAILVDNEIIQAYDPLVHEAVAPDTVVEFRLERLRQDDRWVLCKRPIVLTGGELTLSMLDLDFDESSRYYNLPPQMKANNGLLIIDDLGRQLVKARDLMNRWIVPLDRHLDYLTLHNGKKFMVPFDVIVVFSTNLKPTDLADEAFLRRLGYKIPLGPLDEEDYRAIFKQVCEEFAIPFAEEGLHYLLHQHHYREGRPLLACTPRDILRQVLDVAKYDGVRPELNREMLDWAWHNYFTAETLADSVHQS
jgi:hypothetical protein